MKTIVTTIQREQNKVIRNEEYKTLIVQGPEEVEKLLLLFIELLMSYIDIERK